MFFHSRAGVKQIPSGGGVAGGGGSFGGDGVGSGFSGGAWF